MNEDELIRRGTVLNKIYEEADKLETKGAIQQSQGARAMAPVVYNIPKINYDPDYVWNELLKVYNMDISDDVRRIVGNLMVTLQ